MADGTVGKMLTITFPGLCTVLICSGKVKSPAG